MEPKSLDVAVQQVTGQNLVKVWLKFFQSVAKDLRNTVSQLPYWKNAWMQSAMGRLGVHKSFDVDVTSYFGSSTL